MADAGLTDRVEFLGRRTRAEIASLIGSSDVLVAASVPTRSGKREGIPVVLMEAMSAGLPVVASALSGIPELVIDGSSGLTVPPGDSPAIAAALRRLHDDPELRTRLGVAARERVVAEFDVDRNARPPDRALRGGGRDRRLPSGDGVGARTDPDRPMIRLLFWSALATIAYTYVGFPLLVLARAALRPRPPRAGPDRAVGQRGHGRPQRGGGDRGAPRQPGRPRLSGRPARDHRGVRRVG